MKNKSANNKNPTQVLQTDASRSRIVSSLLWKFLERGGTQGIQFVVQIVLARLLSPGDYGILAVMMAFITFANIFVQSGLNTALIQKKDADEADFSSVFWLSLLIAGILYMLLYFAAPFIASFYSSSNLTSVLRILSLILFFGAFNSVQNAMVSRTMQFRRFFFSSMGGIIGSGAVGIIFAYKGVGVWALVIQQLANNFLISVILWFTVKWRPLFMFSMKKIRTLFSYGGKLLVGSLLGTGYTQLCSLVVGRVFTNVELGFFNRGEQFPQIIAANLDGSIQSVMLPALSSHSDRREEVKRLMRRAVKISSYVLMPCMFGMAAAAENLVLVLLTEKWLMCVPFVRLSCVYFALYPVHITNLAAVNAMGRNDIYLKLEVIKEIERIAVLAATVPFGIFAVAAGKTATGIVEIFINTWPNKKILGYSLSEQCKDAGSSCLASLFMAVCVYFAGRLPVAPLIALSAQIIFGAMVYILVSKIFRMEPLSYLIEILKSKRQGVQC